VSECVLCDWTYDPFAAPLAAFLIDGAFPLRWYPDGPGPVWASASVADTVADVATVAHWAHAHPEQLELALGEPFEVRPLGSTPPVDTPFLGVDIVGDKVTVVKASKVFIAKAFGVPGEMVWTEVGSVMEPLEFRYKLGYDE